MRVHFLPHGQKKWYKVRVCTLVLVQCILTFYDRGLLVLWRWKLSGLGTAVCTECALLYCCTNKQCILGTFFTLTGHWTNTKCITRYVIRLSSVIYMEVSYMWENLAHVSCLLTVYIAVHMAVQSKKRNNRRESAEFMGVGSGGSGNRSDWDVNLLYIHVHPDW